MRSSLRPLSSLSDVRDSGEIEQDADVVMFVHRPEMYELEKKDLEGYAEVQVRKHRSSKLGDISLRYEGAICRFAGWAGPVPDTSGGKSGRTSRFDG